ncbi:MAG: T9SS type A sorting domain-containing protein [Bacteroidota bacterium]
MGINCDMQLKSINYLLSIVVLSILPLAIRAQISFPAQEKSHSQLKAASSIPELILPIPDLPSAQRAKMRTRELSRLKNLQYAVPIEVHKDFFAIASHKEKAGEVIKRLKISSAGAYSLGIWFETFFLTPGTTLSIFNSQGRELLGPLTHRHNKGFGSLMLQSLPGDELILEYRTCNPEASDFLTIGSLYYDYMNLPQILKEKSIMGYGSSGYCNVDINCKEGDMWQQTKKSVCKITYNGWLCSGTLMNNVKEDGTPYLLTANHCISSEFDANNAVFYFNYENEVCGGTEEPVPHTLSGATLMATAPDQKLDFSLLQLSTTPPPHYDVYYAGWNADSATAGKGASIHHPQGDVKKISLPRFEPVTGNYGAGYDDNSHWQITEWNAGTTEGGSSGSPLFDHEHRVIGDLTGGDASCSYNYNDFYSKLNLSWDAYPDDENQLKTWLNNWNLPIVKWDGLVPFDSLPSRISTHTLSDTLVQLKWVAAKDTTNWEQFLIYRNGHLIDSTKQTNYIDSFAIKNQRHEYVIAQSFIPTSAKDTLFSKSALSRPMHPIPNTLHEAFALKDSMPAYWFQESNSDTVGWKFITGGGPLGPTTAFAGNYNASFTDTLEENYARLITTKVDLSEYTFAYLKFYYVLPQNHESQHTFNIYYRTQDSLPWIQLRTIDQPTQQWKRERIGLPQLSANLEIAFEASGTPNGGGVFLDSIAILEDQQYLTPSFKSSHVTTCIGEEVIFTTPYSGDANVLWSFGQDAVPSTATGTGPHTVSYTTEGRKDVSLQIDNKYYKKTEGAMQVGAYPETPNYTVIDETLTTELEFGIQWHLDGLPIQNATSSNYTINESGYYKLSYTNAYGCTSYSPTTYMVYTDVAQQEKNLLQLQPNPAKDYVEVRMPENRENGVFELFDIAGRKVVQQALTRNIQVINLTLPMGTYLVRIQTGDKIYNSKLVIGQ